MEALTLGGASNYDAIRAATLNAAKKLGLDKDLGSIEEGKIADLIILQGDPLVDIRDTKRIRYVIKDGKFFDPESMAMIWPDYKPTAHGAGNRR